MRTGDKPPGWQNVLLGRAITDYVPFFFVFCFCFSTKALWTQIIFIIKRVVTYVF